jgi:hypothetical protein
VGTRSYLDVAAILSVASATWVTPSICRLNSPGSFEESSTTDELGIELNQRWLDIT